MRIIHYINKILGITLASVTFLLGSSTALAQTTASPFTTGMRYNLVGQVTGIIRPDPDGIGPRKYLATRNTYNTHGLLVKTEKGELNNWQSHTIKPKNWNGFTVISQHVYTYDAWGRVLTTKVRDANNIYSLKQYSYDALGRVQCKAIRMNPSAYAPLPGSACSLGVTGDYGDDRITKYTFNSRSQVTKIQKAYGTGLQQNYATYTYTGMHRDSVTDANGNYAEFRYDGHGRLSYWYFPSKTNVGQINSSDYERYTYDENDNRKTFRRRSGKIISYSYDKLNRIILKDIPDGSSKDVYYGYNHQGLQVYARFGSDEGVGITDLYDGFGNLKSSTNDLAESRTLTSHYDLNNNRYRLDFPDGQYFSYSYDGLDRMDSLSQADSNALLNFSYNNMGRVSQRSLPSGAITTFGYDGALRITDLNHDLLATVDDLESGYGFNPANQVVTQELSNDRYFYIEKHRLTGSYQANGLNQYDMIGGKSISYDTNGNLDNDGSNIYGYDVESRLVSISGDKNATLSYDPLGRLYSVVSGSNATYFLYDGDALVAEYDSAGIMRKRYLHGRGHDVPLLEYEGDDVSDSAVTYLYRNHQGSIIGGSNHSGVMSYINSYDAYGIPATTNVGRFAYTGQIYLPEIDLFHYKARVYNPYIGRFMQTDPVGYEDQVNLYAYVHNDPLRYRDPEGTSTMFGWYLAANSAADGDPEKTAALMKDIGDAHLVLAKGMVDISRVSTIGDVVSIVVDATNGEPIVDNILGAGTSTVAENVTEGVLSTKLGKDGAEAVSSVVGAMVGNFVEKQVENALEGENTSLVDKSCSDYDNQTNTKGC